MPDDWFSPTLQLVAASLWPVTVIVAVLTFRTQIRRFIDEISEFTGFGANAKRAGVQVSEDLRNKAQQGTEEEADTTATTDPFTQVEQKGITPATNKELVAFVGIQIESNLKWAQQNCAGSSRSVCAEIVRSSYTDLRLGVRIVGYSLGGPESVSARTARHAAPQIILQRVGASTELSELVTQVRAFSTQVRRGELQVNEQAARNYIESLLDINQRLFNWAEEATVARAKAEA